MPRSLQAWLAQSIAHRISFAAASLSGAFVILVGLLSFIAILSLMRGSVRAEMDSKTLLVEERLSRSLSAIAMGVEHLAQSSLVTTALVDSSGRISYLEPYLREYRLAEDVPFALMLTDHAGRQIAGNRAGIGLPKPADWIRRQVERNEAHAEMRLGDNAGLLLAYPVIFPTTNTPEGLLLIEVALSPLLERATQGLPVQEAMELTAGGRQRMAIGRGQTAASSLVIDRPLAVSPLLRNLDLHVVATRSWAQAYGPLVKLGLVYALVAVLALLLALRLARAMAQRVVAPLQTLTEAAHRNRAEPAASVDFQVPGHDEVSQLGAAMQHLVEQLHAEHESLERRVAERTAELNDLTYIIRRASNGVIVADPQGRIEWVNEGFVRLSGYTQDEVRGRKPGDLLQGPDSDPGVVRLMRERIAAGQGFAVEIVNYHKSGVPYWVAIDLQPICDEQGRVVKFVALETDISERKRVEQLKTDFVSVVSHELRTPLTAIRGALGLMAGGVVGELPPMARDMTQMAQVNSERLMRLINDLLDIQKLESGKMVFELAVFPLADLLRHALAANQPYAQRYKVAMVLEGDVPATRLRVDEGRFQQVMANLLSNAAKFSPEGATVRVAARPIDGGWVQIRVSDRGAGIPEAFRARVFQKFSQADSSDTRAKDGTGLGLSITKALIEGMGGRVGFETESGRGTTFMVEFPPAEEPPLTS